jgi:DNA-binding CsgD family transcriptional regulator
MKDNTISEVSQDNVERQYFVGLGDDMRQICSALIHEGIIHFSHVRRWKGDVQALITTHVDFSIAFIKNKFYQKIFHGDIDQYQSGFVFIDDISERCRFIRQTSIEIGCYKPDLLLIEKSKDCLDFYWFGTSKHHLDIHSYYLNKIDFIRNFLQYFKSTGRKLLERAYTHKMIYQGGGSDITPLVLHSEQQPLAMHNLEQVSRSSQLTPCERLCAYYLCVGHSPKEISVLVSRSYRTVEKHIFSLKKKMRSRSIVHLVAQLLGSIS